MQAVLPAAFARLGLSDPAALFDAPGLDGAAIRQALVTALDRVPAVPGQPATFDRQRLLAEAGRILLADPPRLAEAIHLTRSADPALADSAPLAHIRLIALWRLGDRDGTLAEADRVLCLIPSASAGRKTIWDTLCRWNLERFLPSRIEYLGDFWPEINSVDFDPFGDMHIYPNGFIDRIAPVVAGFNERDASDQEFLNRIRWGGEVRRRILYIRKMSGEIRMKPRDQRTESECKLSDLEAAVNERLGSTDFRSLQACLDTGHSALIVQAHVGLSNVWHMGLPMAPFPLSIVANVVGPPTRPQDFHLSPEAPDAMISFAKLAKLMRKGPRVVRMFPDGAAGDTVKISVFGRKVPIGRGAASLAYMGNAAVFFSFSRWNGTGFDFPLVKGPTSTDYQDREAFEQEFSAFYAACLEKIVRGPPEDMAPEGVFWPHLIR